MRFLRRRDVAAVALALASVGVMARRAARDLDGDGPRSDVVWGMVPLAFAAVAQMIVMAGGDIDLFARLCQWGW